MPTPTKVLIVDINNIYKICYPLIIKILKSKKLLDPKLADECFDYCLNSSLFKVFCLPVVYNKKSGTIYDLVYCLIRDELDKHIFNSIPRQYLVMFSGSEVKTISNEKDLYILSYNRSYFTNV
jgi:hypothetical protein